MKYLFSILLSFLALHLFAQDVIVSTKLGQLAGTHLPKSNIDEFLGIPFAQPPVGDLRWKAPQVMNPWAGIRPAKEFGPSPMQAKPSPFLYWSSEFLIPESPISEDCLYLNVWAPSNKKALKPVLVYIYGGGFRSGGSACPIYKGEAMAQKEMVFVSINYRVGVFGFLAHPELSAESGVDASGNYGILDMIAALKWVKENISAFGGDPNLVTIAGQSAGSMAVNYLCASPLAKGLFKGAIAESGASILPNSTRTNIKKSDAEMMGLAFAKSVGSSNISALRALSAEKIQAMEGGLTRPYQDGYVLPQSIQEIYQNGKQNDVGLLMGWNADDKVSGQVLPASEFQQNMEKKYGINAGKVFKYYPFEKVASQFNLSRDELFGIQVHSWAKAQNLLGKSPVYVYQFNRALPAFDSKTAFGAFHTGEVPYAYANLQAVHRPWEQVDYLLSEKMSNYWANFVKTGDPNGKDLVLWPAFTNQKQEVQLLDQKIESKKLPNREALEMLEDLLQK
ncbi:carboxylesterase/lipase family protein [Aquirufa sp. ROCK-SH2]